MTKKTKPKPSTLLPGAIVWAYTRDSGGERQEQSVAQQERAIGEYCKARSFILARTFADVAKSGGSVKSRNQFLAMIDATAEEAERPAGILVYNFARFSRDVDQADYYKATLRMRGILIHSLTDPIPEGYYSGVIEKLIDQGNEETRRQNSIAVKRAMHELIKNGYMPGTPPRGYIRQQEPISKYRDGKPREVSRWIPDPKLFDLVQLAWKMRAQGKSYKEITKATEGKIYLSVGCWASCFANRSYLGEARWGDLTVENHHAAAIDLATWNAVQALKKARPSGLRHPMRIAYPSPIGGLAFCLHCGSALTFHTTEYKKYPWAYYYCGKQERTKGIRVCEAKRIGAKKVNALVLDVVLNKVLTKKYFDDLLHETKKQYGNTEILEQAIEDRRHDLNTIERAINNLYELVESFGASETLKQRIAQKEIEQATVKADLAGHEARRDALAIEITPEALALVFQNWRDQITEANNTNDIATVRSLLSMFVEKIEMSYRNVIIHYTYPVLALTRLTPSGAFPPRGGTPSRGGLSIAISLEV